MSEPVQAGSYRLTGRLGEGGMGVVYAAEHTVIGKRVAVKVLLPEFSKREELVTRFFNEARASGRLAHPGIVEIFDFGHMADGSAYIVMQLLEGEPLSKRLHAGVLSIATAVALVRQIAGALAAAHKAGIVHRDMKPDNVFLVRDPDVALGERAKILDFGIAKLIDAGAGMGSGPTRAGSIMGTPPYMAPEQCRGLVDVDHRVDVYAVGCILFEMLAGRPPFVDELVGDLLAAHMFTPPPSLRSLAPAVSPGLDALVTRMLAKKPDDRVASMEALVAELGGLDLGDARSRAATPVPRRATPNQTTLSHSAGELPVAGSRRRLLPLGMAIVVAVAGLTVALALYLRRDDAQPPAQPAAGSGPRVDAGAPGRDSSVTISDPPPLADATPAPDAAPPDAGPLPIDAGPPPDAGRRSKPPRIDAGTGGRRAIDAGAPVQRPDAAVPRPRIDAGLFDED